MPCTLPPLLTWRRSLIGATAGRRAVRIGYTVPALATESRHSSFRFYRGRHAAVHSQHGVPSSSKYEPAGKLLGTAPASSSFQISPVTLHHLTAVPWPSRITGCAKLERLPAEDAHETQPCAAGWMPPSAGRPGRN